MTIKKAVEKIVARWDELYSAQGYGAEKSGLKAVWFFSTNHSAPYEIDEEYVGVTKDGDFAWAWASGCSCWDGDYETDTCKTKDIKAFKFTHDDMKAEWESELIAYANTL